MLDQWTCAGGIISIDVIVYYLLKRLLVLPLVDDTFFCTSCFNQLKYFDLTNSPHKPFGTLLAGVSATGSNDPAGSTGTRPIYVFFMSVNSCRMSIRVNKKKLMQ